MTTPPTASPSARGDGQSEEPRVHWIGGVSHPGGYFLAGWPCCCSGKRCRKIAAEGNVTRDPNAVTCKVCLRVMAKDPSIARRAP